MSIGEIMNKARQRINGEVIDMIDAVRKSDAELAATRKENEELRSKLKTAADSAGKGIQENLAMRLSDHTQCQKIQELNTEIHHLTGALNAAQKGVTLAHGELEVARTTLSTLNRQKDELEHKLVTATQTIGTLEETARELRSWLNARDAQVAALNNDIARKGHFAAQMVMRAEQAEKDKAVAETKLAKAQQKIGEMYVQQNLHGNVIGSQFEDRIKELESYLNNVCTAAGTESYDNLFDVVTYQRTAAKELLGVLNELKGYVHPDLHYDYTIHLTWDFYQKLADIVDKHRNLK